MNNIKPSNEENVEFAFGEVPQHKRKNLFSLILVLAGYPIALSNFVIGGTVGVGLKFTDAILALTIGNLVLISIVILTGIAAYKTGLSTSLLSKRAFGKSGSYIFSSLLALSAITWVALNGDIFSRLVIQTFDWWPLSVPLTAIVAILLWLQSAVRGYKGLEIISGVGVPAALILSFYGVYKVGQSSGGFEGVLSYIPASPIAFSTATAAIVGGWIFGATITPDVCRYANKKSHVFIAGIIAFILGCFGLQFAGVLIAISTGQGDFALAMASLGLVLVAFFASVFCLWTTQDNNIYGASLAIQNIIQDTKYKGKIKHKHIAVAIASIAAILAAGGIYSNILPIITFLSVLIPPVPGIIIAQEFFVKKQQAELMVNQKAMISWLVGSVLGYISLQAGFFIPAVIGVVSAGLCYILINTLTGQQNSQNVETKTEQDAKTIPY
ncbi:thiamine permease [Peribacillus saganii]|uniref:Thiamine permease n=1 Tax=Peribacillus saganii TaxID=2303992 RepID=A0A372LQQ2_9BACI|nr:cytosine permease [Peribacillus saganii]RFU70531.1 thiamine permease [Peribacillus saganii]